jgi:hypothetical protein
MDSGRKSFALILIVTIAISCANLLAVKPADAQSASIPLAPEFTAKVNVSSLEVTIRNQPITACINGTSNDTSLYYMFRFKDHQNSQNWNYAPIYYVLPSTYGTYFKASASDYTVVSFPLGSYPLMDIVSGQADVQVIALIGNEVPTNYENRTVYGFNGVTGTWSNTVTVILPANNSPLPTVPEHSWWVIVPLLLSIFAVTSIRRHRKTNCKGRNHP